MYKNNHKVVGTMFFEDGKITTSDEIEQFMWFGPNDDMNLLSNTLKNEVVPFCLKQDWYIQK